MTTRRCTSCGAAAGAVAGRSRAAKHRLVDPSLNAVLGCQQELDQLRRLLGPPLDALTRLAAGDGVATADVESVHLLARRVKDLVIRL